jgi:hypothetical protein
MRFTVKESTMFKFSALITLLAFTGSSWFSGFNLPRLTHGPIDYLLMPLFGYFSLFIAAQITARFIPDTEKA